MGLLHVYAVVEAVTWPPCNLSASWKAFSQRRASRFSVIGEQANTELITEVTDVSLSGSRRSVLLEVTYGHFQFVRL